MKYSIFYAGEYAHTIMCSEFVRRSGNAVSDYPVIMWSGTVAAGTYTVQIIGEPRAGCDIKNRTLIIWGAKR